MQNDLLERFNLGMDKFNEREFYECHDILEDVWFEIRGQDRKFYQGLIHLAVGFYHILHKNNPKGALSQLNKGITKLSTFKLAYQGVELENLVRKVEVCINEITLFREGKLKDLSGMIIPKIKFDSSSFKVQL
jgi:predicted metal-dependent hydrolase